jgi:hypothetical protein
MPCDALAQQVELALASLHESLAAIDFLETPMHGFPKSLDLLPKICDLKIEPQFLEVVAPALCISSND